MADHMRFLRPRRMCSVVTVLAFLAKAHFGFALDPSSGREAHLHDDHDVNRRGSAAITTELLLSLPSRTNLRSHLYDLTRRSHVAGTPGDHHDAAYVLETLSSLPGFDAHIEAPEVMLTYPNSRPHLVAPSIGYVAKLSEDVVSGDDTSDTPWRNHTFSAYSPSGNVTARVVYANYGRPRDFDALSSMGISVEGTIVVMRYGECFRGLKVMNAERRGAAGSVIYSDPQQDGCGREDGGGGGGGGVYPDGPWRPPSGVQRGSVRFSSIRDAVEIRGGFTPPGSPTSPLRMFAATARRI